MKIRTRLTIYFTILILLLIIIRSAITYTAIYKYNEKEFYERLHAKALTTAFLLLRVQRIDSAFLKIIDRNQYDLLDQENITVYDSTDREMYTNNDTIFYKTSKALFDEIREKKSIRYREGRHKILAFAYEDDRNKVIITAGAIDEHGEALLSQLRLILLATLIGSVIVMSIMGWFFVGRALRPISDIVQKVKTLSPLEHSERLPTITEKDEIAALINTFNDLFDKLEDLFRLQKNFVANVSHELNNPLTKIKSQLEVSLMHERKSESYKQTMGSILEDVNELIILVQDLLKFSRVSPESFISHSAIRIDELLFEIRDQVLSQFPEYSVQLNFSELPGDENLLVIQGNKQLLTTALRNIVENACKYSPDKSAMVTLLLVDGNVRITIHDNGPGIPASDLPHIFDLFYRAPGMESVKGYGIGLPLAQRILKAHNFDLQVMSELSKGTTFTVLF